MASRSDGIARGAGSVAWNSASAVKSPRVRLVRHAVGVSVFGVAELLGRLHPKVLIHRLDRELAQRGYRPLLHERADYEVGVYAFH